MTGSNINKNGKKIKAKLKNFMITNNSTINEQKNIQQNIILNKFITKINEVYQNVTKANDLVINTQRQIREKMVLIKSMSSYENKESKFPKNNNIDWKKLFEKAETSIEAKSKLNKLLNELPLDYSLFSSECESEELPPLAHLDYISPTLPPDPESIMALDLLSNKHPLTIEEKIEYNKRIFRKKVISLKEDIDKNTKKLNASFTYIKTFYQYLNTINNPL